jgi:type VI secretion system protein ImpH
MASSKRLADSDLIAQLAADGKHFGFFQAVDVIERASSAQVPVGHTGPAELEAIRFEHDPSLTFHASDIKWIAPSDPANGRPYTVIRSTFMGLFGAASPLPITMAEDVLDADASDQPSLRAFYDLFHHRLLSLCFRVWQKNRFVSGHRVDMTDPFTRRALALVGVDVAGALPEHSIEPLRLLGLAPLLGLRARTPHALATVAAALLEGIEVRIESFVLRRTELLPEQRMTLGVRNSRLGVDTVVGGSVADRTSRYRLVMGPLSSEHFTAVSPGGRLHDTLCAICTHFSDGVLEAEVEIEMAPEQVPRFKLGDLGQRARLGHTTRLGLQSGTSLRSRFVVGASSKDVQARVSSVSTQPAPL